jgi:hypothetical protein
MAFKIRRNIGVFASIIIGFSPIYALLNFTTVELKTET